MHAVQQVERYLGYLEQDPNNTNLLLDIIESYRLLGDKQQAQIHLNQLKELAPNLSLVPEGLLALTFGELEHAIELFQLALQEQDSEVTRYNLSFSYFANHDLDKAYDALMPVIQQEAPLSQAYPLMARILHHQNKLEEAIQLLTTKAPQSPDTDGLLALLYFDSLNEEKALFHAQQALANQPQNYEALCVMTYLKLGQQQCSSDEIKQLIQQVPNDGRFYAALGNAQMLELDMANAEQSLTVASQLMPHFAGNWLSLGWCQLIQDNLEGAKLSFEKALELDKTFAEPHGGLAILAVLNDQRDEAQHLIKLALKLDDSSHLAMLAQALYHNAIDPNQAKAYYEKAIQSMATAAGLPLPKKVQEHLLSKTIH